MPPLGRSASEARKGKDRESTEHRRARSEVGCSECRRLKLRCDNSIPCNACTKRGCQIICSNGMCATLDCSRLSSALHLPFRFIPIDTKNVHRKLLEMSKRISQLEDALKISHAAISNAQHPLLSAELLKMKAGISPHHNDKKWGNAVGDELDKDIMSSFGDLTNTERDGGGDQHIDRDPPAPPEDSDAQSQPALPFQVSHLSRSFPFGPRYLPKLEIQQLIEMRLPLSNRASSLCESYLESISWWIRPIDRSQLLEELMPTVYGNRRASSSMHASGSSEGQKKTDPHDLAALLMVFAIGAVGDFTLSPNNEEAELYYHLSRSALCLNPVFDGASLASVQTIALMGAYDMFSFRKKSLESTWKVLNFGMTLATSVYRDPTHWKFEPKMIQRRRTVFWELRNLDAWKSLASGRPSTIAPDDVDCELPIDSDATLDEEGKEVPSFWRWKHLFLRDVLSKIAQKLCSAKPLKYSEILELDQSLREFGPIHLCDQVASAIGNRGYSGSEGTRAYLQQYLLSLLKDMALQFLHRNFFARALLENPANPMQSAFAPSFIAAFNSAYSLLHVIREHFDVISHVMLRYWSAWTHSLTACVIIGSVAARAPSSDLAPRAYVELLLSLDVFAKAQMHPAVRNGLVSF
ncbi:hypothetical protein DFH11DRAFT_1511062 [Phellopilus nigrolimitatus]|nr:hypothetical protein DFH11DRAFT_1511062 [Phellopilus nigrolimitatus]